MAQAHHLLAAANEAYQRNDLAASAAACGEALLHDPTLLAALALLAGIRRQERDLPTAIALMRRYIAINPSHPGGRNDLCLLLIEADDIPAAEVEARACLRLSPDQHLGHQLMASVMLKRSRTDFAEWHLREVIRMDGETEERLIDLASATRMRGHFAESRRLYRRALDANPGAAAASIGLSRLEIAAGNYNAALAVVEPALRANPRHPELLFAQGRLLAIAGRSEEALRVFDEALACGNPPDPRAKFEKGRLLDRLGKYDEAMAAIDDARDDLRRNGKTYAAQDVQERFLAIRSFFIRRRMELLPRATRLEGLPRPIFIMGFPRSGTTLMEQIVSAHSQVAGGDELPFVEETIAALPHLLNVPLPYPGGLTETWMADRRHGLDLLRDHYLLRVRQDGLMTEGQHWVTDKMPLNEIHLAYLELIFPGAPRIRMVRHPLDVVVSCYFHYMNFHDGFDASLADAAHHYALVSDLYEHYRTQVGVDALAVRYEDLVADPGPNIRRVLDHIGLSMEDSCLRPERNSRPARTPSNAAVREPINNAAVSRYRPYLRWLEEPIEILRGTMNRLGYIV